MATEVRKFRSLVKTWLGTISGLSARVGTRIYPVAPPIEFMQPALCFNIAARESVSDIGAPAWVATVEFIIHAASEDVADEIEELIVNTATIQEDGALQTALTDANTVQTTSFVLRSVNQDWHDAYESGGFVIFVRVVSFSASFVKRVNAW